MNHSHLPYVSRRQILLALSGVAAAAICPLDRALALTPRADSLQRKRVILYTLFGGNDGLNTLVPYRDDRYLNLRPTLGLPATKLLPVSDELALNPGLTECMKLFQAGELAIIQDVGYPHPNLSHFESAAIWDSANPALGTAAPTGWYGEVVMHNRRAFDTAQFDASAITFDKSLAFASGERVPVLQASQNMAALLRNGSETRAATSATGTAAQLAALVNEGIGVRSRFAQRLAGVQLPQWQPYEEAFDIQTKLTEWFFAHGVTTPLVRVNQGGFDTHSELLARHGDLMHTFDRGIARLKQALVSTGTWNDTVIMVHSEFGRRAAENGYGGTDHGTAGPVFLIGGKVRGGIYGQRASLDDLDIEGNIKYTTDFRSVYSTLVHNLWQLPGNPFADAGFSPLNVALA